MHIRAKCCAGDVFYVIEEGTFTIFENAGSELARVTKGSCFGELALLHQVTSPCCCEMPSLKSFASCMR